MGLGAGPAGPGATVRQREAVKLAFVATLRRLPGNQRAALLLFEVLGFSAARSPPSMDTSTDVGELGAGRGRARWSRRSPPGPASSDALHESATSGCGRSSPSTRRRWSG